MKAYLHVGDVAFCGEVHPVGLVQLGSDHVVQVRYLIILTDERGCQQPMSSEERRLRHEPGAHVCVGILPVSPSLECALMVVTTRRNIAAGTTCTSSSRMKPHSRDVKKSIIFLASCDLLWVFATIE